MFFWPISASFNPFCKNNGARAKSTLMVASSGSSLTLHLQSTTSAWARCPQSSRLVTRDTPYLMTMLMATHGELSSTTHHNPKYFVVLLVLAKIFRIMWKGLPMYPCTHVPISSSKIESYGLLLYSTLIITRDPSHFISTILECHVSLHHIELPLISMCLSEHAHTILPTLHTFSTQMITARTRMPALNMAHIISPCNSNSYFCNILRV